MNKKNHIVTRICLMWIIWQGTFTMQAEELLVKYDFNNGTNLPAVKHQDVVVGSEFDVYNTTTSSLEMILQEGVDYLSVKNTSTAVDQKRYGYLSVGPAEGKIIVISRIEVRSKKGNDNTLNARCYLYDTLKNTPTILSNMIYSGTNGGYPVPEDWELQSFVPLAGPQILKKNACFSFTSTQKTAGQVASEWYVDELTFYGTVLGGNEKVNDVNIMVDVSKPKHVISRLMNGSHFVYGKEADSIYKDERIAEWMRSAKTGIIRWPGGTAVQSYHWDNLTGDNFGPDRWDTSGYVENNISPVNYMDLDEYIAYCRKVNAEPMVGINIRSGKFYRTDADGLDEARRLIQYCVDKNYQVKHWYIGNEGYASGFGANLYAQYIDMYAAVLRQVDPSVVIIGDWKFGPETKGRYEELLSIIAQSTLLDVMEVHEKWGNGWGLASGTTLEEWKNEFPIYEGKLDSLCRQFHSDVKIMGKTTRLGMNEWGIGGMTDGSNYHYALLAADLMTQMFKNDVYSACYWNLNISTDDDGKSRIFITKNNNQEFDKFNPISKVFQQYAPVLGCNYLEVKSNDRKVYGIGSLNQAKDTIQILLLNKSAERSRVKITMEGFSPNDALLADGFDELGLVNNETINAGDYSYILPAYSFTRLQFTGVSTTGNGVVETGNGKMKIVRQNDILRFLLPDSEFFQSSTLWNMHGKELIRIEKGEGGNEMPVKSYNPGVYIVKVKSDKMMYVEKVLL